MNDQIRNRRLLNFLDKFYEFSKGAIEEVDGAPDEPLEFLYECLNFFEDSLEYQRRNHEEEESRRSKEEEPHDET